ncbi:MAG TPA: sulfotransferase domain-containing protein, partial [Dongiaceae bacterium]|nr:sulfotransferase domain-containing protein [Dongiaceae bacterium]
GIAAVWIFCGGMPRAGSTVQFQLTAHLVERAGRGARVEWVPPHEFPALRARYAGQPGWKVFKSHACTPEIRAELAAGAKGVYVYRDVRDVVVSRMRKRGQTADRLWRDGVVDQLLASYVRWTESPGVLISRYETMVADLAGEVERIAAHLGIESDRAACADLAAQYTVPAQRERIRQAETAGRLEQRDGFHYDPTSNLHVDHIRSGKSGEWRDVLTRTQVALIERRAGRWLQAHGYPLALPGWQRAILTFGHDRWPRGRADTAAPPHGAGE